MDTGAYSWILDSGIDRRLGHCNMMAMEQSKKHKICNMEQME